MVPDGRRIDPAAKFVYVVVAAFVLLGAFFLPARAQAETIVGSSITQDTTWGGGETYHVTGAIDVRQGIRLIIQAGAIVLFDFGAGIDVYGQLEAVGQPGIPVVFTGAQPSRGSWRGLRFFNDPFQRGPSLISHAVIEYGGGLQASVYADSTTVTVENTLITEGGKDGIRGAAGGSATVRDTRIENHSLYAMYFSDPQVDPVLARLQASGNGVDAVGLTGGGGSLGGDRLWEAAGLPYVVLGVGFTVAVGETLTIEPGAEVRFSASSALNVAGRLIAAGTRERPIVFTGVNATPGFWQGIRLVGTVAVPATAVLSFAVVEYGGLGDSQGNVSATDATASIEYCRIRAGGGWGVRALSGGLPRIGYSQIIENALGGAKTTDLRPGREVQALHNWWGDPSGPYHPVTNPQGLGSPVSDHVIFDPWLTGPEGAGPEAARPEELQVEVIGRSAFAPGSRQTYAIAYRNGTPSPVFDAVLVAWLPSNAFLVGSSAGGFHWGERGQVFWRLGTLQPADAGVVAFSVEYFWALPFGLPDSVLADLGGSNVPSDTFVVSEYLAYTPPTVTGVVALSDVEVAALRLGNAELEQLYLDAVASGFRFIEALRTTSSDGTSLTEVDLLRVGPPLTYESIFVGPSGAVAAILDRDGCTVRSAQGAIRYEVATGGWLPLDGGNSPGAPGRAAAPPMTYKQCMLNCIKEKANSFIFDKIVPGVGVAEDMADCQAALAGDDKGVVDCGKAVGGKSKKYGGPVEVGTDLGVCNSDCKNNPASHICTKNRYECRNTGVWSRVTGLEEMVTFECNLETGQTYTSEWGKTTWCGINEKCVQNSDGTVGCRPCKTATGQANAPEGSLSPDAVAAGGASGGQCTSCQPAKDPNAKLGVEGYVAPGQTLTYTVQYENVGAGEAYGVFVTDVLAPQFDETTIAVGAGGRYLPASRTILWDIGTLAPKGQPGSSGEVTFSAALRADVPAGTALTNRAVVFFPSVPERTPTNPVVNIVQPLAGADQEVTTVAGQPVALTLAGYGAAVGPLNFTVVGEPEYGSLSGAAPGLEYLPMPGFVGDDALSFIVDDGLTASPPARVTVHVVPDPNDVTPPVFLRSSPADGATVRVSATVSGNDGSGPLYPPLIRATFSEPLRADSATGMAVTLMGPGGMAVPVKVMADAPLRGVWVMPRARLESGARYTLTMGPPLADLVGNVVTRSYSASFTVSADAGTAFRLYLPLILR